MKAKRRNILAALIVAAGLLCAIRPPASALATPPEGWLHDWEASKAASADRGKPVVAMFSTEWCGPCKAMKANVLPLPEVKTMLDEWVTVYIDCDEEPGLASKFEIEAYPTFVLISPEGTEEDRFLGYRDESAFVNIIGGHQKIFTEIKETRAKLEETPEQAGLWNNLAELYLKKSNDEEALKAYEKAVYYDPKDETGAADDYYFLNAVTISSIEEMTEGAKKLAVFETKYPSSPLLAKVQYYRGIIAINLEELPEAAALLREGVSKYEEGEWAEQMRGALDYVMTAAEKQGIEIPEG